MTNTTTRATSNTATNSSLPNTLDTTLNKGYSATKKDSSYPAQSRTVWVNENTLEEQDLTLQTLRSTQTNHYGSIDIQLSQQKSKRKNLEAELTQINQEIKELEEKITKDQKKSNIADVITKTNPLTGSIILGVNSIIGLNGKQWNPGKDATQGILKTKNKIKLLHTKEETIKNEISKLNTLQQELEQTKVRNFLADVAHAAKVDSNLVRMLDSVSTRVSVEADSKAESDATFNDDTGVITLSQTTFKDALTSMQKLQHRGLVDADGKIKNQREFLRAREAKDGIETMSLLVHELRHDENNSNGITKKYDRVTQLITKSEPLSSDLETPLALAVFRLKQRSGMHSGGISFILNEYQTYLDQEKVLTRATATKNHVTRLVTDKNGRALPITQAVRNLADLYLGRSITYGPSAGYQPKNGAYGTLYTNNTPDYLTIGDSEHSGRRHHGRRHHGRRHHGEILK